MSDIAGGSPKAPKAVIETGVDPVEDGNSGSAPDERAHVNEAAEGAAARAESSFHEATFGFFRELGRRVWEHADAHPHATLYGIMGFALAVLILVIGLWNTIVIAVFVGIGVVVGQMRDGDNAAVNFIRRLRDK